MIPLLALETSTRQASVAFATRTAVESSRLDDSRRHASDLIPLIDELTKRAEARPQAIAVGLGPGSYTGLRVGLATASGIARAMGIEVHGVSSFEVAVFGQVEPNATATILTNAYGGRSYVARYLRTTTGIFELRAPEVVSDDGARAALELGRTDRLLVDASVATKLELCLPSRATTIRPTAADLVALVRADDRWPRPIPLEELEPLYLQSFGQATP